jgi:hypothetical protein
MTSHAIPASISDMTPMHRLQMCIDDERFRRVSVIAHMRGTSIAAVIRDAIDIAFVGDPEQAREAARRLLVDEVLTGREPPLCW